MLNKMTLVGNLGSDPKSGITNDKTWCRLSIATTEVINEEKVVEWHSVVLWGKQAENAAKYLKKGRQVYVEGPLRKREFEDKQIVEVKADKIIFLGNK